MVKQNSDVKLMNLFDVKKVFGSGRRKKFLCICIIWMFSFYAWLHYNTRRESNEPYLEHFRRNRNLSHYMNSISLLTEPNSTPCDSLSDVPLLVLVASAPNRYKNRDIIRATWGPHFPTYFLLGLNNRGVDKVNVRLEAQQYNDVIVYDFQDHYQNLTLKTALMLRWTQDRCSSLGFLMKTDDDILVNPWIMKNIIKEHNNAKMIGYKLYNIGVYHSEFEKWYIPPWLYKRDFIPQYLLGAGYLIKGKYVKRILDAAVEVPLVNIEDIYFTYLVAKSKLGLKLTHDPRMNSYSHWFLLPCLYWPYAISHDLSAQDTTQLWRDLADIGKNYENNKNVCSFYKDFSKFFRLLYI